MESGSTGTNIISEKYMLPLALIFAALFISISMYVGLDNVANAIKENTSFQKQIWNEQTNILKQEEKGQQQNEPSLQQQNQQQQQTQIAKINLKLDSRPIKGDKNSKVVLVGYEEFLCPFCIRNYQVLKNLENKYKDRMSFIHMNFIVHEEARISSRGVECAGDQGKYYEMFDKIFESQGRKVDYKGLLELAEELKLDVEKFSICINSSDKDKTLDEQMQAGRELGVRGTPSFVIFQNVKNPAVLEKLKTIANDLVSKYGTEARVIEVAGKGYGVFFVGALPQESFEQIINALS